MPRVKRGTKARTRRKRVLKRAKGFYGRRKSNFRRASEAVDRALAFSYKDRKKRPNKFRRLWIIRISAAVRQHDMSYSRFIAALSKSKIGLDRKSLAQLAVEDPKVFGMVVKKVQAAA